MPWRSISCLCAVAGLLAALAGGAFAEPADASAGGTILSSDGVAIARASVTLSGNGPTLSALSDASGTFAFAHLHSGTYTLGASARGYNPIAGRTVQIVPGAKTSIELRLPRLQASSLTLIGTVRANGAQAISTLPAPTLDISTQPYAQQGETRVSDILADQLSTTVVPVLGGGLNAPMVVSLRGPDPSETLVDIDGHQVNNGGTGDFDLSLLDPADLTSAQVVYGIAPSSLYGPNTLGGALNVRTLEPTAQTHFLERLTVGTFDTFGETVQATGTDDRLGYALSFHRLTSGGDQEGTEFPTSAGGFAQIGDSLDASSTIAKLRYAIFNGAGFVGVTLRDQAVYRDVSSTLSSSDPGAGPGGTTLYSNFSGSSILSHNAAYGLDAQVPIGPANAEGIYPTTALFRHQTSVADQTVDGPGAGTSPYLYNDRDIIGDDTLEIDHALPRGELSLRYALTDENLTTDFIPGVVYADAILRALPSALRMSGDIAPTGLAGASTAALLDDDEAAAGSSESQEALAQTERSLGLRYAAEPTSHLHYDVAAYSSDYSTFGRSIDPRFGFVWTPRADSAARFSVGSTFQSPQLPTFIIPPSPPMPVDGYSSIGNPHATAERATSYDLGYEHRLRAGGVEVHLGGDVYRTDLHNGVATFLSTTPCPAGAPQSQWVTCESYPTNVTQEVYNGIEVHSELTFPRHDTLKIGYDVDSVYTQSVPPTSLDNVVAYEQALGVPLHKLTLDFDHDSGTGIGYYAGFLYEGAYNETNLGPYALLRAGVTLHTSRFDIGLYGTNLTDVYDFKQQIVGGGIPYGGLSGAPFGQSFGVVSTNAIPLAPRTVTFSIAHKV
jgi:outer membrane cobalamin receptor